MQATSCPNGVDVASMGLAVSVGNLVLMMLINIPGHVHLIFHSNQLLYYNIPSIYGLSYTTLLYVWAYSDSLWVVKLCSLTLLELCSGFICCQLLCVVYL